MRFSSARNGNKLSWIFLSFGIGSLAWLLMLFFPPLHVAGVRKVKNGTQLKGDDLREMLSFFKPVEDFFITPIIIDLNILMYLLMVISGLGVISFQGIDLLHWGANYRPLVVKGEWWRLVSSIFLHGGLIHLLANMIGLIFVGIFLEPVLGRVKYALIYLSTGIIASCASAFWHPATVSIGASGAIFGLYGLFMAFLLFKIFPKDFNRTFLVSTIIFVGYNLLMGLTGGIDNAAHIGGLVSGFVIGVSCIPALKKRVIEQEIT